ncbi:hypothetical protein BC826DRAFT_626869 [Russula brevipes]|nr:hypothetical protein BC826DRAFT_626869 [Russula brevipes]
MGTIRQTTASTQTHCPALSSLHPGRETPNGDKSETRNCLCPTHTHRRVHRISTVSRSFIHGASHSHPNTPDGTNPKKKKVLVSGIAFNCVAIADNFPILSKKNSNTPLCHLKFRRRLVTNSALGPSLHRPPLRHSCFSPPKKNPHPAISEKLMLSLVDFIGPPPDDVHH